MSPLSSVSRIIRLLLLADLPNKLFCATLPSAAVNDCAASEIFFGPCLPGQPRTCPGTCPPGCHCTVDSCCYPRNNPRPNPNPAPAVPQQNTGGGDTDQLLNLALLMLLFRQRSFGGFAGIGGFGGGLGALGCQDAAWNCFQFAPMCLYSVRMLSLCPRTCGICPSTAIAGSGFAAAALFNAQFAQIALANALGNGALG